MPENVCKCGRAFSHCKNTKCGSKNVYVKKARSFELSEAIGRQVTVFGCRRCMRESTSEQECKAPSRDFNPEYVVSSREAKRITHIWGDAVAGSIEHATLLNDWIKEQSVKGWDAIQIYIEAQKAGWHLEAFGDALDEDVRKALKERGLLTNIAGLPPAVSDSTPTTQADETGPGKDSIDLDDIIRNMQENAK
jgi:hypothetical protein